MNKVREFQDEYRWLSNFAPVNIQYGDYIYASVEAAFMSAKSEDISWKLFCADPRNPAGKIKKESKLLPVLPNWFDISLGIMEDCLRKKFTQEPYYSLLLATGDMVLEEGNMWNDKFWGICLKTGHGHNHLGRLIMKIRKEL